MSTTFESTGSPAPPDWSAIHRDIFCPLCDYNLRGLSEPRCPECGHRFVWKDVVMEGDRTLPFLFEHRRDRNVWSFFKTLAKSCWSLSFWRTLLPIHTRNLRRLMIYWTIMAALVLPILLGARIWRALELRQRYINERISQAQSITYSQADPKVAALIKRYGSIQAVVDAQLPMPGFLRLLVAGSPWDWQFRRYVAPGIAFNLLWPWLTVAALMIFRASLAQARIKVGHVLRCVVYSHEPILALVTLALIPLWLFTPWPPWGFYMSFITSGAFSVLILAMLLLTWRLAVAYRLYLRFPHAIATVVASQVIVGLALFKAYLVLLGF